MKLHRKKLVLILHCFLFVCAAYVFLNALPRNNRNALLEEEKVVGRKSYSICKNGSTPQVEDVDVESLEGIPNHVGGKTGCKESYVTLLTSDYYLPGTLVLVESIRSNMIDDRDMVVVITHSVSETSIQALQAACVIIKRVKSQGNPNKSYQPRFEDAYTKMTIWAIDEYEKMVYADSDQFAVKSYDSLFDYPAFSAEERTWSDNRYTSSLMVLEPSRKIFNDMRSKFSTIPSDDGADMGFISSYFPQELNRTIPYYFAIWRRTVIHSPDHWDWDKIHGVDCSGWKPEKPWAENWYNNVEKEYVDIYKKWWEIYFRMLGMEMPESIEEFKTIPPEEYAKRLKSLYWTTS